MKRNNLIEEIFRIKNIIGKINEDNEIENKPSENKIKFGRPSFPVNPKINDKGIGIDSKIHIVAPAIKDGGFCMEYLAYRSMAIEEIARLCDIVNDKNEAQNLFPTYRVTLIPINKSGSSNDSDTSTFESIPKGISEIDLKTIHFVQKYFYRDSKIILFIVEQNSGYDTESIKKSIQSYIKSETDPKLQINDLVYLFTNYNRANATNEYTLDDD